MNSLQNTSTAIGSFQGMTDHGLKPDISRALSQNTQYTNTVGIGSQLAAPVGGGDLCVNADTGLVGAVNADGIEVANTVTVSKADADDSELTALRKEAQEIIAIVETLNTIKSRAESDISFKNLLLNKIPEDDTRRFDHLVKYLNKAAGLEDSNVGLKVSMNSANAEDVRKALDAFYARISESTVFRIFSGDDANMPNTFGRLQELLDAHHQRMQAEVDEMF